MQRPQTPRRKKGRLTSQDAIGYLFMAPLLLSIAVFTVYPMIDTFLLSLQQTNGINGIYVGLDNYRNCFTNPDFHHAIRNTFYMGILSIMVGFPGSFLLASLINKAARGKGFFKSVYFLPNIVSIVAVAIIFKYVFNPTTDGLLNYVLSKLGVGPFGWFTDPKLAGLSIVLMGTWKLGYDAIIFLAGLQGIPGELYEAADIDGAGELRKWWSITIPNMKPIFTFMIIMMTISQMKRFGDVYMIGSPTGNPSGALTTIVLYIYRTAFKGWAVGLASAAAYILFAITLVLTLLNLKLTNQED